MKRAIAILVGPPCEDQEVWHPKYRLEAAGFPAPSVGVHGPTFKGKDGYPAQVEQIFDQVNPAELAGTIAPVGWTPEDLPASS